MTDTLTYESGLLYCGDQVKGDSLYPEAPGIYPATAYIVEDTQQYDRKNSGSEGYFYNRTANPNRDSLGEAISYLEGGEKTLICSSGMAAISTCLLALADAGDHILFSRSIYGETIELADNMLKRYGIQASYTEITDIKAVKEAIRPNTRIIYSEITANPLITVADIRELAAIAKECGALLVIDNTFTTPYTIRPLDFGADIVINSLTKFINGHSDVTAGAITASEELIKRIRPSYLLLGGCLDANSSWLALRSIRTFGLRMERHNSNALKLAEFLEKDPHVKRVNYPGLKSHKQHELAAEILKNGYGPMLSFLVEDDREKVDEFLHRLKIVKYLGTLGGYRTSVAHPATAFRFDFAPDKLIEMGMTEGLIRISVGTEDIEDIIKDIRQALTVFD